MARRETNKDLKDLRCKGRYLEDIIEEQIDEFDALIPYCQLTISSSFNGRSSNGHSREQRSNDGKEDGYCRNRFVTLIDHPALQEELRQSWLEMPYAGGPEKKFQCDHLCSNCTDCTLPVRNEEVNEGNDSTDATEISLVPDVNASVLLHFSDTDKMSAKGNIPLLNGFEESTTSVRPKIKKSSSDANLSLWSDEAKDRKSHFNRDEINLGGKLETRSYSYERGLNRNIIFKRDITQSCKQKTVELPEAVVTYSVERQTVKFPEPEIRDTQPIRDTSIDINNEPERLVDVLANNSTSEARGCSLNIDLLQEERDTGFNEERTNHIPQEISTDCIDYSLDPGDLIYFEELDGYSTADDGNSVISVLEDIFMSSEQNGDINSEDDCPTQQCPEVIDEIFQEDHNVLGRCLDHGLPFYLLCIKCNLLVCPSCTVTNHREECSSLLKPRHGIMKLKEKYRENARTCIKNALRLRRKVCREVSGVEAISYYYSIRADQIKSELDVVMVNLQELKVLSDRATDISSDMVNVVSSLKETYKNIKQSSSYEDILIANKYLEKCRSKLNRYTVCDPRKTHVIPNIQIQGKQDIIGLLKAGAPLYGALQRSSSQKTYAQLSLEEDFILLHCLRDDVYPNDGVTILAHPFESLMKMLSKEEGRGSDATIFLDIGWAGEKRGRVYVRLFGNTPRTQQVLLLCSGEKGSSYRNTLFYKHTVRSSWGVSSPREVLYGGDYEYNDGSGSRAIVEDITDGDKYDKLNIDGLMVGWPTEDHWRLGSFRIFLQGNPTKNANTVIGVVTQGLGLLRAAAKQVPNSYICDCGIVIPLQD